MQHQGGTPSTGMNWPYFLINFVVCLAALTATKIGLDTLSSHLVNHARPAVEAYHSHMDSLQDYDLLGITQLHVLGVSVSALFPFSRIALRSLIGTVINVPLMMPLGRLMYYRAIGLLLSLALTPVLGPLGMMIILKRYFQFKQPRRKP